MNFFNNYRNIINNSFQDQNVYKKIISEKGLSEIKYINYNNDFKEQPFCPITQKKFKDNILVAKLPCNHIFEPSGILFWLKNNNSSCPVCRHQMDYIEIKDNVDISNSNNVDISANHNNAYANNNNMLRYFNNVNPINDVFQYTFDINNQNIPYNFNIRYNILNLDLSGENVSDLSGEEILIFNNNTDLSNNINTDLSNNNTDLSNNNTDLSNNIYSSLYNNTLFTRIENEIVNTLTNLYYRRQEERDLEMALMNSLQDN